MNSYSRRRILATGSLGLSSCVATAGCLFNSAGWIGVNKNLVIENRSTTQVQLHIVVQRDKQPGAGEYSTVFDEDVVVPPNKTKTLEVLGDHQYRIQAEGQQNEVEFWARPICDSASTRITVTTSGELDFYLEGCE